MKKSNRVWLSVEKRLQQEAQLRFVRADQLIAWLARIDREVAALDLAQLFALVSDAELATSLFLFRNA